MTLTQNDKDIMLDYLRKYGSTFDEYTLNIDDFTSLEAEWSSAKRNLHTLLGGNLILERPISIENDPVELMHNALNKYKGFNHLLEKFKESKVNVIKGNLENLLTDSFTLGTNSLTEDMEFELPNGKHLKAPAGSRPLRLIQKLSKTYSLDKEYEAFYQAHSIALNQKKIEGTLCLSIHPMDFFTCSDNRENWSTCMSIINCGDYRAGIMESITSPSIVIAYVKSDKDMEGWNSKRWRCMFIVDKMGIVSIRPYPYMNSELIQICGRWLEELARKNLGWKYEVNRDTDWFVFDYELGAVEVYDDTYVYFNQDCMGFPDEFYVELDHFGIFNEKITQYKEYEMSYQGKAICPICGETLDYTFQICCAECAPFPICERCGQPIQHQHDVCWTEDDTLLCKECYDNEIEIDSITGNVTTDWVEVHLEIGDTLHKSCIIDKKEFEDKTLMAKYFMAAPRVLDDDIAYPEYYIEHYNVSPLGMTLFGFETMLLAEQYVRSKLNLKN